MASSQRHRGQHPRDSELFHSQEHARLREALQDLCTLLSKGYPAKASLSLVGDRYRLRERQRLLLGRCAVSQQQQVKRQVKELSLHSLKEQVLFIDGFNLLICIESALSGGLIFEAQDGCYKDLASIHGSYRRVEETTEAIEIIGKTLASLELKAVYWHLDRPVSNSGRLKQCLLAQAEHQLRPWQVSLDANPDAVLKRCQGVIVTSDGAILDAASAWFNLAKVVIRQHLPQVNIMRLKY